MLDAMDVNEVFVVRKEVLNDAFKERVVLAIGAIYEVLGNFHAHNLDARIIYTRTFKKDSTVRFGIHALLIDIYATFIVLVEET